MNRAGLISLGAFLLLLGVYFAFSRGCSDDGRVRNEANRFLDRYQHLDVDDDVEERRPMVDALGEMALATDEVRAARDACVEAHRALIEAEDQHALARHTLVEESGAGEREVPREVAQRIEAAIAASEAATARSQERFPVCQRLVSGLETRFRQRAR